MEFPTIDEFAKNVAEKALDEILYEGKTVREWVEIIVKQQPCEDCIRREDAIRIASINSMPVNECVSLIRELPSVKSQQGWIPVSERLPDTDDEVLCWYKYYHWSREKVLPEYGLGRYLQNTQAWYGEVAQGKDVEVIAWMPLPEPYKEESEE
jgi:hypothetical protein